jgi:TorA maturation chaperone TorD
MTAEILRAEGYRLLGLCFTYPDPEDLAAELEAAAEAPEPVRRFAELAPAVDDSLADEFTRLFATSVAVPPCETSYMRADKGARLGQLSMLYDSFGTRSGGRELENPDHIGAELEFAALVCLKQALAAGDPERRAVAADVHRVFATEHLGRWIPTFAERLRDAALHPFYRRLAPVLENWVQADLDEHGWTADRTDERPEPEEDGCPSCPMAPRDDA